MEKTNTLFNELEERGFIKQSSDENMEQILEQEKATVYVGTNPTADSLHVGHLVPMLMLSHFKKYGHKPILLVGGATGMIGDPSFKNSERQLLTLETVKKNTEKIAAQIAKILNIKNNDMEIVNNYDWYKDFSILDFLRDVGKHFSVNNMLAKDSVKSRIETKEQGISFTEFSYSLLQAYDFVHLNKKKGCNMQIGGSDQWGNIVAGIDLIKKKTGNAAYAITCPLITKPDGTKFGKSEGNNVRLDPKKTSPYKFFQFWMNVSDEEAARFIKLYTFIPLEEIQELTKKANENPEKRILQKKLAIEITKMIHGERTQKNVLEASEILFGQSENKNLSEDVINILKEEITTIIISKKEVTQNKIIEELVKKGVTNSKGETRKIINSNGISINGRSLKKINVEELQKTFLLKKGKKTHILFILN